MLAQSVDPAFLPRPLLLLAALPRNELGKTARAQLLQLLRQRGLIAVRQVHGIDFHQQLAAADVRAQHQELDLRRQLLAQIVRPRSRPWAASRR